MPELSAIALSPVLIEIDQIAPRPEPGRLLPRGRIDVALVEAAVRVVRVQPFGEQRLQLKKEKLKVGYGKSGL